MYELISKEKATELFNSLINDDKIHSLNPDNNFVVKNKDIINESCYWYFKKKKFFYLYPFILSFDKINKVYDIQSHYPYGHPFSNTDDVNFLKEANQQFLLWTKKKNILAELVKIHPLVNINNIYPGKIIFNKKMLYIDLKDELIKNYSKGRKSDVKKSIKNSNIFATNNASQKNLDIFINMYNFTMKNLNASNFYLFDKNIIAKYLKNNAHLWIAYYNQTPLASAITIYDNDSKIVEYFLAAKYLDANKYKMPSFLIHKIASFYKSRNFIKLFLGGGTRSDENDTLYKFKKNFTKNDVDFSLGHRIFNKEKYEQLKKKYPNKPGILFYRNFT